MNNIPLNTFDIETAPRSFEEMVKVAGPFDPNDVALGNLKDPDKIEAKIAEARRAYPETLAKRALLDPMLGMVSAIGLKLESGTKMIIDCMPDEAAGIRQFWEVATSVHQQGWAGWNIFNFDLGYLRVRSLLLGIRVPDWVSLILPSGQVVFNRYFVDLMLVVTGHPKKYLKLDTFCRAIGLEGKNGDGALFYIGWTSEDPAKRAEARDYLNRDIDLTDGAAQHLHKACASVETSNAVSLDASVVEEEDEISM